MPASVKGGVELRKALKKFAPDLAKETQKELAGILKPITAKAKGFIPSQAPLSGWANSSGNGRWATRAWSSSEAKRGIGYRTAPSRPNKSGWRSLASIVNASTSGAIYETAGRKNPQGRPQAPLATVVTGQNVGKQIRSVSKGQSASNNPYAGQQFIDAINQTGQIENAYRRQEGQAGRVSGKMRGRAIFRAWAEDQGKTQGAYLKAIESSKAKFLAAVGAK